MDSQHLMPGCEKLVQKFTELLLLWASLTVSVSVSLLHLSHVFICMSVPFCICLNQASQVDSGIISVMGDGNLCFVRSKSSVER